MDQASITRYISESFTAVEVVDAAGGAFFFNDPEHKFPFATIVVSDEYDTASDLNRPGVFRLNIGIGKQTFAELFVSPIQAGAGKTADREYDFAALDQIMPHPVYGMMYWVCVLNPSDSTFQKLRPLIAEAYELSRKRYSKQPRIRACRQKSEQVVPNDASNLDLERAHRHFSGDYFNRTWTLIEKTNRTPADDEAMLLAASASLWHWTQRADRTDRNLSIGHWLLSRVHTLLGDGDQAMRHAEQSLRYAAGSPPFYLGYAHEAIARAANVLGDAARVREHLGQAKALLAEIADQEERAALEADLKSLPTTPA